MTTDLYAMLNGDCWGTILFLFKYDFRTLSRLMCVSHQFLNLAAPVLYSRLGHPDSKKLIKNWSINKRKKLSTLLLTSSGFLNSTSTISAAPLFVDYFGLLTWMPKHFFGLWIWHNLMEADDKNTEHTDIHQKYNRSTSTARHATVLTEVWIKEPAQIEKWLPHVEEFAKLEKLVVDFKKPYPTGVKEKMLEFVNRHGAVFPGQLKKIYAGYDRNAHLAMELNILRENSEKIYLWLDDEFMESLQEHVNSDSYSDIKRENAIDKKLKTLFKSVKKLKVMETGKGVGGPMFSLWSRALQHCRQMEEIVVFGFLWSQVEPERRKTFAWAPKELEQATMASTELRIDQEQHRPFTLQQSTMKNDDIMTSLVPLKSFIGVDILESVLMDVMDGFRHSLECIDYSSYYQEGVPVCIDWTWSLPNLKVLKLDDCYLAFCKLEEFCPSLEELWLTDVKSLESNRHLLQDSHSVSSYNDSNTINSRHSDLDQESGSVKRYWRAMVSLKVLRFSLVSDSSTLELDSIANLDQLEDLSFGNWREIEKRNMLRQLRCSQLLQWDLSNLSRLTMTNSVEPDWNRLLLRSSPNLEYLSAPMDVFVSENDEEEFWTETKLDTLNRVAAFQALINKGDQPENEHLSRQPEELLDIENMSTKHKTAEEDDTWNAHLTKVRFIEFTGGRWSEKRVKKLTLMFDSGHRAQTEVDNNNSNSGNYNSNDTNDDDSQDNINYPNAKHNNLKIYDQVCFPHLCQVKFSGYNHKNDNMENLVKSVMRHRSMLRVHAYHSRFKTTFLQSLQELDKDNFPETWEPDSSKEIEDVVGYDGPCVLTTLGSTARHFCLR